MAEKRFVPQIRLAAGRLRINRFEKQLGQSGLCLIVAMLMVCAAGCGGKKLEPEVTTGYGRSAGKEFSSSVNGTSVIKDLVRRSGSRVSTTHSISPQINDFDTIVWFRDRFEAPPEDAILRLEDWLAAGYQRQLILVGRDYDSGIAYWENVVGRVQGEKLIKAKRRLAQVKSDFYGRRMSAVSENCDWYESQLEDYEAATRFSGAWSRQLNGSAADIYVGTPLSPGQPRYESNWNTVLKANGRPFITFYSPDTNYYNNSNNSIVLVSNGSFLTNYGMVNQENRKLAIRLIERQRLGKTLFIESGTAEVAVLNSEQNHETWAWITKPPLKYIVPHFLLWGIFFCFVLYPIFGRPKRVESDGENTNFRSHVKAMARLLSRSGRRDLAQQKIERYANRQ